MMMMIRTTHIFLLILISLSSVLPSQKPKISMKKGPKGEYNIKIGEPEPPEEAAETAVDDDPKLSCDLVTGCTLDSSRDERTDQIISESEQKMFSRPEEVIEQLEDIYYGEKIQDTNEALITLALARTVQAALGGENGDLDHLCENTLAVAVRNLEQLNNKNMKHVKPVIYKKAASLATLQSKLLMVKNGGKEKLFEKIGEYLFLQGKLMFAREAFLIALRFEGNQDSKLNIVSSPSTIIKKVLCSAIEHEYLLSGTCNKEEDKDCASISYPMGQQTQLNSIFWGDITRSVTHEKIEWWLAKAKTMSFPHLVEGIYQAGVGAGVYLSRYQRPINAVPGLRAKPVWEVKETGLKKSLNKIKENWKIIRDEGLELMKQRKRWRVDPGWVGLPDSK